MTGKRGEPSTALFGSPSLASGYHPDQGLSGAQARPVERGGLVRKRILVGGLFATVMAVSVILASSAFGSSRATSTLPSSSCGPVFYKGSGSPQLLIATDLPLQGAGRAQIIA